MSTTTDRSRWTRYIIDPLCGGRLMIVNTNPLEDIMVLIL